METFQLRMQLGNDAMQTAEDVAAALRTVADRLESGHDSGVVRDANGNRVGDWELQ